MGAVTTCSFCGNDGTELIRSSRAAVAICSECITFGAQMKLQPVPPMTEPVERMRSHLRLVGAKKAFVIRRALEGPSRFRPGPQSNAIIDATLCSFCGDSARDSPVALIGKAEAICSKCASTLEQPSLRGED